MLPKVVFDKTAFVKFQTSMVINNFRQNIDEMIQNNQKSIPAYGFLKSPENTANQISRSL